MSLEFNNELELLNYFLNDSKYKTYFSNISTFPKPYCENIYNVKGIVLGTDPSNNKNRVKDELLEFVFGLEKGENSMYFRDILKNLHLVGVGLNEIYVQNLCRNYFSDDTDNMGAKWRYFAQFWVKFLKKELDEKFAIEVPVLITAKELRNVLCYNVKSDSNCEFHYINSQFIKPTENKLNRTIIPFYRGGHGYYDLSNFEWANYREKIKQAFKTKIF